MHTVPQHKDKLLISILFHCYKDLIFYKPRSIHTSFPADQNIWPILYKKKHLVAKSANFECESLIHNRDSLPFNTTIWNQTHFDITRNLTGSFKNEIVIPHGTIVYIMATRCDGVPECRNGIDEKGCGFNKFVTVLLGKFKHCCKCL